MPRDHSLLPERVWAVEEITDSPRLTIPQWHERSRTDRDHRRSDRWPLVLATADHGPVQRADIIAIYQESGSDQGAADKAINRWLKAGRIVKKEGGLYELGNGRTLHTFHSVHVGFKGSREVWGEIRGVAA